MSKRVGRLLALGMALVMFPFGAVAEAVTGTDYTVGDKLLRQLQAGSGFSGTLTVESTAVAGKESEAITTLKPLVFACDYIYLRPDTNASTPGESRLTMALADGDTQTGIMEVALRAGDFYLKSSLLGDGWFALPGAGVLAATAEQGAAGVASTAQPTADVATVAPAETAASASGLASILQPLTAQASLPGLETFAAGLALQLHDLDSAKWATSFDSYLTKIDLWIEAYRQNAKLGKAEDGTTTMEVSYRIPAAAMKAQLKQMVLDLLNDQPLLTALKAVVSEDNAARYLNPDRQEYYFYAIDELPLNGEMTIDRTVSLKGDTIALSMSLPLYDSQGGASTVAYDRHKGSGDLPDTNTIRFTGDRTTLQLDYQTYNTLTGTSVYQGTLLRQPTGTETYEVGAADAPAADATKTLSVAFTLSSQQGSTTGDDGKQTQTGDYSLTLSPDYTPGVADEEAAAPTDAQKQQYIAFEPLDIHLTTAYASGQAKNASTTVTAGLEISGENSPQKITLTFEGKTKGKWTPNAVDTKKATRLDEMNSSDLQALVAQAGVKLGLLLLPYGKLPTAADSAAPSASPAP